jgi:16S rRNA (cytosine1402-N4)-methyltransferase
VTTQHVPILVGPIVEALREPFLAVSEPAWLVDCTLGGGGHTAALLAALAGTPHRVLSLDQDEAAVEAARGRFAAELAAGRLELAHARFGDATDAISGRPILGMMADLGFSSDQLERLSFRSEEPLDLRLDRSRGEPCSAWLSRVSEKELERVLSEYAEERFARRIAGAIVAARRARAMPSTGRELAELVVHAIPPPARHGRIHAATRTFQALRIAVNDELGELDRLLSHVIVSLMKGGRIAILSFHSLEDRRVKLAFRDETRFRALTKKPLEAGPEELAANPRARSAKLRIAERV